MSDHPDVFADSFSITANQYAVTLTLHRTEPTGEAGVHEDPKSIVARVRMSPALAAQVAEGLTQASTAMVTAPEQAHTTKH